MDRRLALLLITLLLMGCGRQGAETSQPLTFAATDGHVVRATFYRVVRPRALILLQTLYADPPKQAIYWANRGYDVLHFPARPIPAGIPNVDDRRVYYHGVLRDWEAALRWGDTRGLPIVMSGQDITSAMGVVAVAGHPEVRGFIGFTDGEMGESVFRSEVLPAARQIHAPIFFATSFDPFQIGSQETILSASPALFKVDYVDPMCGLSPKEIATLRGMAENANITARLDAEICQDMRSLRLVRVPRGRDPMLKAAAAFLDRALSEPAH
jgi:hypothetical protein